MTSSPDACFTGELWRNFFLRERTVGNAQPFQHGGRWILVRGLKQEKGKNRSGMETVRSTFADCWTGDGWSPGTHVALSFDTREDAERYLVANAGPMEAAGTA
jgi:hypothetical protein